MNLSTLRKRVVRKSRVFRYARSIDEVSFDGAYACDCIVLQSFLPGIMGH